MHAGDMSKWADAGAFVCSMPKLVKNRAAASFLCFIAQPSKRLQLALEQSKFAHAFCYMSDVLVDKKVHVCAILFWRIPEP